MPIIEPVSSGTFHTNSVNTQMPSKVLEKLQVTQSAASPVEEITSVPDPEKPKELSEQEKHFQALTIKEKQLLRRDQELKRREQELQNKYKPWEEAEEVKKQSKIEALKRLGITYDDVTNEFLGSQNMTAEQKIQQLEARIEQEAQLREQSKKQQEDQAKQYQQQQYDLAIKQIKGDAKSIVDTSQNYPLVKHTEAYDTIVEIMVKAHEEDETGRVMPVEEAIKQVEQDLRTYVKEVAQIPEIRSELMALLNEPALKSTNKPEKSPTLTNKTVSPPLGIDLSSMTAAQKEAYYRQRAINIAMTGKPD